ncbi:hypothetical protein PAPHI01_1121 [Pancytospora philotis]|nr:hypothetical protein PAPHI01_1121 [Pancytospora philotis]
MAEQPPTDPASPKLRAELAIVRSQLKRLEKENTELKKEKSLYHLNKYEKDREFKRCLNVYSKEYQLKTVQSQALLHSGASDSQRAYLAPDSPASQSGNTSFALPPSGHPAEPGPADRSSIDLRYALKKSISLGSIASQGEIEKLRFFRDYFFDDFYSLDTAEIIAAIQQTVLPSALFMEVFELFCCKKQVFDRFCARALEMTGFFGKQVLVLSNVPVEWICDAVEAADDSDKETHQKSRSIRAFIKQNAQHLLDLLGRIAETHPRVLRAVLSQAAFDAVLATETAPARRVVLAICKQGGVGYVNEKNLHLLNPHALTLCFGEQYARWG